MFGKCVQNIVVRSSHSEDFPRAGTEHGWMSEVEMDKLVLTIQVLSSIKRFDIPNDYRSLTGRTIKRFIRQILRETTPGIFCIALFEF